MARGRRGNALFGELDRRLGPRARESTRLLEAVVSLVGAYRQRRETHDAEAHRDERKEYGIAREAHAMGLVQRAKAQVRTGEPGMSTDPTTSSLPSKYLRS